MLRAKGLGKSCKKALNIEKCFETKIWKIICQPWCWSQTWPWRSTWVVKRGLRQPLRDPHRGRVHWVSWWRRWCFRMFSAWRVFFFKKWNIRKQNPDFHRFSDLRICLGEKNWKTHMLAQILRQRSHLEERQVGHRGHRKVFGRPHVAELWGKIRASWIWTHQFFRSKKRCLFSYCMCSFIFKFIVLVGVWLYLAFGLLGGKAAGGQLVDQRFCPRIVEGQWYHPFLAYNKQVVFFLGGPWNRWAWKKIRDQKFRYYHLSSLFFVPGEVRMNMIGDTCTGIIHKHLGRATPLARHLNGRHWGNPRPVASQRWGARGPSTPSMALTPLSSSSWVRQPAKGWNGDV